MKRLLFQEENVARAAMMLFGDREDFTPAHYEQYAELEVVVQEDGRYSVWGNREEDTDLLRDTKPDRTGMARRLERFADEVYLEDESPVE